MDQSAYADIQAVNNQADSLRQAGITLVHIALDNRLSLWKKATEPLHLAHNYKLRNPSKQSLVEALYLTDLPRYVLVRPNGQVVDADVAPTAIHELLLPQNRPSASSP